AGLAVIATHALLRDQLNDAGAAYSFNLGVGDRLAANPVSRQFDQWFLAEARKRQDVVAVANRLHANIEAGVSNDLLETHYSDHFRWLLAEVDGYLEQGRKVIVTDEVLTAYRELAKAIPFSEELSLRLEWAVAVRAYNVAKIAEKEATPPIAEATALLAKFPHYAQWVQTGWAGGGNGPYYRNDPAKYWPHEIEAKMAPVVAAAAKLTPLQLADLMASWRAGYYSDKHVRPTEVKAVRKVFHFVRYGDKLTTRNGVLIFGTTWNQFTPEEAQAVAPKLAAIAHPEASYIRAIAAGGKDKNLDKMIAALIGPEAWRLGPAELDGRYADQLWHYAGRPGDNATRDQKIAQTKAVSDRIRAASLAKEAPANQRLGRFRQLWGDYKSGQPKTPGVLGQLKALLLVTPEAIPELLRDQSVEAQLLARDTIAKGLTGSDPVWTEIEATNRVNVASYAPGILYLAGRHAGGSVPDLKVRQPKKYVPHPLEPALRQAVATGLKQNKLEPWLVLAWINTQYPEDNAEQVKLAQALVKSPLWKTMPFEAHFAAREWFRKDVMTPGQVALVDAADPEIISKDLFALIDEETEAEAAPQDGKKRNRKKRRKPKPDGESDPEQAAEDIPAAVAALQSTIAGLRKAPLRIAIPEAAFEELAALDPAVIRDAKVRELILVLIDDLKAAPVSNNFGYKFVQTLIENPEPRVLHLAAPYVWNFLNRNHHLFPQVRALTQSLVDTHPSAASALAGAGLDAFARHRGHSYFKRDSDIPLFKSIRGNAAMKMGLIVIPVAKNHPAYPVYQSQGDWTTGNEDSAWDRLDEHWEAFLPVHRELSLPYLMWALKQVIYNREEARQEELVKALLGWAGEDGSPLSPDEKARIEIAYGDIAVQRGQLRQAHELYTRTQKNEAYQEIAVRHEAGLRRAMAERLAKNFDGALQTLAELELERIPGLWTEIRYARAEVHFDMEEFEDAKDDIDDILTREPNHPDAKILLGKVQLKLEKLMEATEVELGSTSAQDSLVPGEKLKVTLADPTLAVSGAGTEIEVVVWTTAGDREQFFLRQFGDQKTKFRGEVPTALGAPAPDDGTLQVIGDDEVFYAYSERFREKMNGLEERRGGPITIASDALLMASARKLLSETEQRTADMEAIMAEIEAKGGRRGGNLEGAARARMAARSMDAEARAEAGGISADEFGRYLVNVAKPGNPVHVRVIDPDRSRTAEVDDLTVSLSTSSGDAISRVTLKETGTHTGWFEGSVPTTGAQALAFARNSEPGRNPNMVISPAADTYPAWRPVPVKDVTPEFKVDLNDNVALDELTITAVEEGARLKTFALQTGMNEGDLTTVAVYPNHPAAIEKPWQPSVLVMNDTDHHHGRDERSVYDLQELRDHLARGWITQSYAAGAAGNVAGPSEAMTPEIPGKVKWLRQNRHHNSHVIYRFRGYFHEPREVTRRFKVELGKYKVPEGTHPSVAHPPQFLLAVDGRPITDREQPNRLEGEINLRPGVHSLELWATGWDCAIGFGRSVKLLANLDDPEQLADCPDAFFDPATFPENTLDHRNGPATVTANEAGTEFKVKFAPGSRSRLLKLLIMDHEGSVPALNKLALTGTDGGIVLPVAEDFASLNKNDTLEILTGDKISVRYVDDRFVTETRERHERFLDVAFTNARVEFADMEPRFDQRKGKDMPYYEKLYRFPYDQPLSLAIHDADMDVSGDPDKVTVTLASKAGGEKSFEAVETGDSTGIFKLVITPVAGAAAAANEFQVGEGATITATYLDEENDRPGVPTERIGTVAHAALVTPEFLVSHATVTPLESDPDPGTGMRTLVHGFEMLRQFRGDGPRLASEQVKVRWEIENRLLSAEEAPEGGLEVVHGRKFFVELVAPQYALGTASTIEVFAQTDAGRKAAGAAAGSGFDINVPGTIAITGGLSRPLGTWHGIPESPIYTGGGVWSHRDESRTDRFHLTIPLVAGPLPPFGVLTAEERKEMARKAADSRSAQRDLQLSIRGLVAQPGEKIHLGFRYTDQAGREQWLTASAKVITHSTFDVMSEDFRSPMTSAYVGELLNLRAVDLGADVSDEMDTVTALVQAKSGAKTQVVLRESGPHTGIFKAGYLISYARQPGPLPEDHDVRREGFPVTYGDTIAARYTDGNGVKSDTHFVTISKGADGSIAPFSKQYEDEETAMRTQFSLAEAYLEMAKRHRKLGEDKLAAQEYASAKLLLSKAMDQFTDPETRAHAEYLLGTLTMEEAIAAEDAGTRETRFRAALSRFMTVTGSYPQTLYASKAQYRIATVYEALQEPEIAAQEYVKLAYKYPDSEFLATSMARLGSHFLKKAAAYEAKAKPLLAKGEAGEDKDAAFEGEALQKMAVREYLKTASIFGRLQERFPGNELAGQAGLRSGQAYMRADKNQEAVDAFQRVINEEGYDGPKVRAQAMYWVGMCYQELRQEMAAYTTFKRLTYDFPESEWAAYARGQLSTERLLRLENELELERLEGGL
ncbi:MAG: tetratricopeptide repeat protein, partial [Akkermansiaceae bacterium]|nr:tetratricopeptide repeat protein [Akkermansiaceae bacterium]